MRRGRLASLAVLAAIGAAAIGAGARPASAQVGRMGDVDDITPGATPPKIALITIGRGKLIFEKFGHAALCLDYAEPDRDTVCFNYGTTDFSVPALTLTWNFIRGVQKFFVEPVPLGGMIRFYQHEDRTLWRQDLDLPPDQARAIEASLLNDLREENRYYVYDHFANNCTTKLRDIIDRATGGKLRAGTDVEFPMTFRQMGRRGLAEIPALIAFADFGVGRALDRHPTLWEAMFHPYVLREEVRAKFGSEPQLLYERRGPPIPEDGPTDRPWALLIGLAFAVPLFAARWTGRFERAAVAIAAVPVALVGLVIWTAAIVSTIPGLRWNEVVFLYTPFDLALPILGERNRRRYARVRLGMVVLVSLLRGVGIFRQPLWVPAVIVFVIFGLCAVDRLPGRQAPTPAAA
ncbi:MAG TPA: DUF4105 domain-containing protein [Kofleriaceae bacterium]|nr:DUF4105 domain-containing protein [Kofleriaceae bacterium]